MRGTGALRTSVAPGGALAGPWVRNDLWRRARAVPSLDLRLAESKSLVDATTGQNLVTFTRASSGTYVGSDGVLRTATTNLLLRSEEFDNASWAKTNATVASNQTISPDGTTTADLLTNTTATQGFTQQNVTVGDATVFYTFSVFVKSNGAAQARALTIDGASSGARLTFTFATETVLVQNVGTNGTGAAGSFVKYADGWYRLIVTGRTTAAGTVRLSQVTCAKTAFGTSNEDGTSGIYLWGAQLEQSSTVGEYIPTTSTINSAPRFDHNPTTGESLGLLVEEQRTNLIFPSEDFSAWGTQGTAPTVSVNSAVAPNGETTADQVTFAAADSRLSKIFASTSGQQYTASLWVKAVGSSLNKIRIAIYDGTTQWNSADFTVSSSQWTRISHTITSSASSSGAAMQIRNEVSSASANQLYIWGAQLEAGAFPTSYIPTTTAAATRSADVASISGSNFSSWYRQDEGTVFAEGAVIGSTGATQPILHANAAGADTPRIMLIRRGDGRIGLNVFSTVTDADIDSGVSSPVSSVVKSAAVYKVNDFALTASGVTPVLDTSGNVPTVDRIGIGFRAGAGTYLNGTIRRLTYWPQRLSNSTLQQITQ